MASQKNCPALTEGLHWVSLCHKGILSLLANLYTIYLYNYLLLSQSLCHYQNLYFIKYLEFFMIEDEALVWNQRIMMIILRHLKAAHSYHMNRALVNASKTEKSSGHFGN